MLIRLIISPADENRSGANQMRQHLGFREHFRRGNAPPGDIISESAGDFVGIRSLAARRAAGLRHDSAANPE
jgi:hypothetical protein